MFHVILSLALLAGAADVTQSDADEPEALNKDVAKAARYFRIQVYHSYHQHRGEYNRRRELGDKVVKDWKEAGQPESQREQVIQWFERARYSVVAGGQTPAVPEFKTSPDLLLDDAPAISGPVTPPAAPKPPAPKPPALPAVEPPAAAPPVLTPPAAGSVLGDLEPADLPDLTPSLAGPPPALPSLTPAASKEETPVDAETAKTGKPTKATEPVPPLPAPASPWNGSSEPAFSPLPFPVTTPAPKRGAGSGSR